MENIIRFFQAPDKSYFLFGPRGTGKSTWLKIHYPDGVFIDLLEPDTYRVYRAFPERFQEFVTARNAVTTFIIDEVQKAPDLLSVVHLLIEKKQGWQFILTGSSSRKLKRQGVDLLAGRATLKHMHPFMAAELEDDFSLEKALSVGMLPLIYSSPNPLEDLKTYVALYMKEEVQMEGLVRNIDQFARFLEAISFSQASVLNYSNVARECGVSSKTVENYVEILDDLLLGFTLPIFSKKAKRHLISHPKFYYFDAGVYQAIRPKGPLDAPEEIHGLTLETLVMQHLRAWLDYSKKDGELYFWRTKSGLEIDFIVYGEIGFYAIEVKNSQKIKPEDLRGLNEFQKDYEHCECILLYRGKEILKKGNVLCMPVADFLLNLRPDNKIIDTD
ncbi:MAG: ATP-binding protein [Gammaproteobacteria bacterium]